MGHTFSRILLHVIFSTKGRRPSLYPEMRVDLIGYLGGVARKEDARVLVANAVKDHVHLLLAVKPRYAPSDLIRKMKTNSSRWIHGAYPELREFSWQSGFGIFSLSESAVESVGAYIRNQEDHHRRMPFAEELRLFLEKYGIEYDAAHFLD